MTIHLQRCADSPSALHRRAALDALSDATQWVFQGALAGIGATVGEWRRRMRARGELSALDDRMLQDIGLSRSDAEFLANKPFWRE